MIHEYNAKRFCKEDISLIENYEEAINDKSSTWDLHHRRELTEDGEFAYSREDLTKMNLYYQRPANELIFLRKSEHSALHHKGRSDETRAKISAALIGNAYGKGKKRSEETKAKISAALKGRKSWNKGKKVSAETRLKMSDSLKKYWQNRRKKKET